MRHASPTQTNNDPVVIDYEQTTPRRPLLNRLLMGPTEDPRWARPALLTLLLATAFFYFYNLTDSGYGNEFYAAAVQSGTKSWKAFLFGSSDWANAITVDKTPASLWPMELFGRIFGFSSWSMLAPNVIEGIASVGLLYAALRKWFGPSAGLLAGVTLALTPAAALMFRFNNPDAALVFLLTAGAYCVTRAIDSGHTRWMVLTGICLGFGFLAKELQALLVVPGFALAYVVAAPTKLVRRIMQLIAGLVAMLLSAGWWLALATLWPTASRPYFGGSTHNSIIEVILGGNGLSRLTGNTDGTGGGGANFSGTRGWGRLFNSLMDGQISWLLPATLIALALGIWLTRHATRTNKARAALLLWGGWFVITALTFSFMNGTVHTYYTIALAPAIAALLGIMVPRLWNTRDNLLNRLTLASMLAATGAWSYILLNRTPDWHPWLRPAIAMLSVVGVIGILLISTWRAHFARISIGIGIGIGIAAVALSAALLGPTAYAVETVNTGHHGSIPSAGPSTGNAMGFGGSGFGGLPGGNGGNGGNGTRASSIVSNQTSGGPGGNTGGGMDSQSTVDATLVKLLQTSASKYTWAAATVGSQSSAGLQLASNVPVMSIGGFTGSDPSPTLAQFQAYVSAGKIHYFVAGGGMGGGQGGPGGSNEISTWVAAHFTASTIGGETVYDLTAPTATS